MNEKHPTIKFMTEWSQTLINFLDVTFSLIDGKVTKYLYVKTTDKKADPNCVVRRNVLVRYINQYMILPILKGEASTRRSIY